MLEAYVLCMRNYLLTCIITSLHTIKISANFGNSIQLLSGHVFYLFFAQLPQYKLYLHPILLLSR